MRYETLSWNLSQFLHGEQLAMFVAGQLAAAVPWIDAKLYGATQVMDEARHTEVFSRYLHEKLGMSMPSRTPPVALLPPFWKKRAGISHIWACK